MLSTVSRLAAVSPHLQPAGTFLSASLPSELLPRPPVMRHTEAKVESDETAVITKSREALFLLELNDHIPQVGKTKVRSRNEEVPVAQYWNLCWSARQLVLFNERNQ